MFSVDDEQLVISKDSVYHPRGKKKKKMYNLLTYAKNVPPESIGKLEEVNIEDVSNIDNEAPVVHSVSMVK